MIRIGIGLRIDINFDLRIGFQRILLLLFFPVQIIINVIVVLSNDV